MGASLVSDATYRGPTPTLQTPTLARRFRTWRRRLYDAVVSAGGSSASHRFAFGWLRSHADGQSPFELEVIHALWRDIIEDAAQPGAETGTTLPR